MQYYNSVTEFGIASSLSFSIIPIGDTESSDEKDGVRIPSLICACVRGDKPRRSVEPFRFCCCGLASCPEAVLERRGLLEGEERDGGRSSKLSTGVVLRDDVRE